MCGCRKCIYRELWARMQPLAGGAKDLRDDPGVSVSRHLPNQYLQRTAASENFRTTFRRGVSGIDAAGTIFIEQIRPVNLYQYLLSRFKPAGPRTTVEKFRPRNRESILLAMGTKSNLADAHRKCAEIYNFNYQIVRLSFNGESIFGCLDGELAICPCAKSGR